MPRDAYREEEYAGERMNGEHAPESQQVERAQCPDVATCIYCGRPSPDGTLCDLCAVQLTEAHGLGTRCPTCREDDCACGTTRERIARGEDRW